MQFNARRKALRRLGLLPVSLLLGASSPVQAESPLPSSLGPEAEERHTIYLLLTYALVASQWRVRNDDSDLRTQYSAAYPGRRFEPYYGHNIGALLLGPRGNLIAFEMNDATYASNSMEHAEARVVKSGNARLNRQRFRNGAAPGGYASLFEGCTVYTTLESCTQCAGIMHLAGIGEVVYGQTDELQQHIGQTIYGMHAGGPLPAPRSVQATFFPLYKSLIDAFAEYQTVAAHTGKSRGTTAFLSTTYAFRVFDLAASLLRGSAVTHSQNRWHKDHALKILAILTDEEVLHVLG